MGGPAAGPAAADLRLAPAALIAWVVAWWASAAGPLAGAVLGCAAATAATACVVTGRMPRVGLAAAAAAAVAASAAGTLAVRGAGPFPQWVQHRAVVELSGQVTGDPHRLPPGRWATGSGGAAGTSRYAVRVQVGQAEGRGEARVVRAPVLVLAGPAWARLAAGHPVAFTGRLAPAAAGDDVAAVVTALGPPRALGEPAWWWRVSDRVRAGLREAVAGLPPEPAGLLPSLVVGDTSTLTPAVEQDLRVSGLTHLTAVSGANVAIVVGSVLWICAGCGARGAVRLGLAAFALVGFVVLARPEPSVLRAAAMGSVALLGLGVGRRPRGVPALAAAVVVLLVADPWLARSAGFALSATATAGLLLLAPTWAGLLRRWLPHPLAVALAAPAAAAAVCAPIVVLLTPSVSTLSVPANLLAEPAVAPATVLGLIAALASLVWPWGAHAVAALGCLATWWITAVADRVAAVPGATLPWLPGVPGALILAALTAAVVGAGWWWRGRAEGRPGATGSGRPPMARDGGRRGVAAATAVLAAVALVLGWLGAPWLARVPQALGGGGSWPPPGWSVAMCDVGQGDALVLRSGPEQAVLVDAGPDPDAIDGCLARLRVRRLDLVVLTHFHADHVLGLPGALHGRPVGGLLVSRLDEPAINATAVRRWAAGAGLTGQQAQTDQNGQLGQGGWRVSWSVVPGPAVGEGTPPGGDDDEEGSTVNESSVAAVMTVEDPRGGRVRVAGLGDLELDGQRRLAQVLSRWPLPGVAAAGTPRAGPVDVVKVAHHGSAKQDHRLYAALAPRVALIGVGRGNDYGHPTPSALRLLASLGVTTFRTDLHGDIAVVAEPSGGPLKVGVRG